MCLLFLQGLAHVITLKHVKFVPSLKQVLVLVFVSIWTSEANHPKPQIAQIWVIRSDLGMILSLWFRVMICVGFVLLWTSLLPNICTYVKWCTMSSECYNYLIALIFGAYLARGQFYILLFLSLQYSNLFGRCNIQRAVNAIVKTRISREYKELWNVQRIKPRDSFLHAGDVEQWCPAFSPEPYVGPFDFWVQVNQ